MQQVVGIRHRIAKLKNLPYYLVITTADCIPTTAIETQIPTVGDTSGRVVRGTVLQILRLSPPLTNIPAKTTPFN